MGIWSGQVVPRCTDLLLRQRFVGRLREEIVRDLEGTVLEIGFGSGLTLPHYPPAVREVLAVEPSAVARRLAAPRIDASRVRVSFAGLDGQELPFDDATIPSAVSTFTLCSIPDVDVALRELRRVLRSDGTLRVLEHGLSPDPAVARWQRRLDGFEQRVAGGCHLDRDIAARIRAAGFSFTSVRTLVLPGPRFQRPWSHLTLGAATPADQGRDAGP